MGVTLSVYGGWEKKGAFVSKQGWEISSEIKFFTQLFGYIQHQIT